ncbi:nSTAND1 domain-containing NTPase [Crocosphaera chwakensis]|uniref:Novel STAND NTPase 1 domain-containing protein n=1 Tax=Crocosphaera chwakensis CCY0110 TaxID=391612 RepID=A3IYT8_9CHRO|nr:ATP-binding protein [Crocosphaera chwakensis]EAZ88349.1 hypothetical protein CY0110_31055 [Crocosphaera chwakensis CCY0110]
MSSKVEVKITHLIYNIIISDSKLNLESEKVDNICETLTNILNEFDNCVFQAVQEKPHYQSILQKLQAAIISSASILDKYGCNSQNAREVIKSFLQDLLYSFDESIDPTFFGRQQLLSTLEKDLSRCQGVALLGIKKSGKTSVLLQLKLSMQKHPIVYIDLQLYGGSCYGAKLFNEILKQLQNLLNKQNSTYNGVMELFDINAPAKEISYQFVEEFCRLSQMLEKNNYSIPIVCLLDEIENIFPTEKDSVEKVEEFNAFFGTLRSLSQSKSQLSLLVTGVYPDFNHRNNWTQPNVSTNPVFQFFKEIYLQPFTLQETRIMLTEMGQSMGIKFELEVLDAIQKESSGHPFIAQQISILLNKEAEKKDNNSLKLITYSSAKPYLKQILDYSDSLRNYFQQDIWDNLKRRNFNIAITILSLLAYNDFLTESIIEEALLTRLNGKCCTGDCESALLWLDNVGLIKEHQFDQEIAYSLQIPLLSKWVIREFVQ